MKDKPFALIGVNGNAGKPAKLKATMDKLDLPWRTFADDGTIFTKWNAGTPSYFLLDAKGVIRHKWIGSPGERAIDGAVEKLLRELEKEAK